MQLRAVPLGQADRVARRLQAGLTGPNERMVVRLDRAAGFFRVARVGRLDQGRVFAVRCHEQRRCSKDRIQRIRIVHQHVARRRAHEDLDAAGEFLVDRLDGFEVGVRCA